MINREELAICKRRGHGLKGLSNERWKQCRWCGMWLREVCVIEEREDEPIFPFSSRWYLRNSFAQFGSVSKTLSRPVESASQTS